MRRVAVALVLLLAACRAEQADISGIRARVSVDRTQTRVGDPIGVTIEVETPPGFALEAPASPGSAHFFTDSIKLVDPIRVPGGVRHHLLWTLRAREVGDAALPELELGIVPPGGQIQRLSIGTVPLSVLSVRDSLPERDVYFDIRPAPEPDYAPAWIWVAVAGLGVFALLAGLLFWVRASSRGVEPRPGKPELARRACALLDDALAEPDARLAARRAQQAILEFAGVVWSFPTGSVLPDELPPAMDLELVELLRQLERVRFARATERATLLASAQLAQERLRHVALA